VPLTCRRCGSTEFRTSRFRSGDLLRLLLFQLPVRCRSCKLRDFVFLPGFFAIRRAAKTRHKQRMTREAQP